MSKPNISVNIPPMPAILTTTNLSVVLGVSAQTAHRLVKSGEIRSFRVGNRYRIRRIDVIKYISGQPQKSDDDLTVRELAEILNVSEHTAYNFIRSGQLRSFRDGYHHRIPVDAVEEFLKGSSADLQDSDYRVKDLPPILGISYKSAYRLVTSGKIRSVRVGSSYRIPKSAVKEYLDKGPIVKEKPKAKDDGTLSVAEAAEILNISYQSTLNRVSQGEIRSTKVNGRYKITREAIDEYLQGLTPAPDEQADDSMSLKELEQFLGITHTSAYNLVFKGKIRSFRVGNHYRISKKAVEEYLSMLPPPFPRPEGHISVKELMDKLGLKKRQAYILVWSGELPSVRHGNRYWIPEAAVEEHRLRILEAATENSLCPCGGLISKP